MRAELGGTLPPNLVVEDGPMADHLARASALVTVSSTAVLEAVAEGVPSLVIDEFGVEPKLINTVFVGSGLFGGADALVVGRRAASGRRRGSTTTTSTAPTPTTGSTRLDGLVARRPERAAPAAPGGSTTSPGGALRRAFERKRMLGPHDRSFEGAAAMLVALPVRWVVRRVRRLRNRLAPARA